VAHDLEDFAKRLDAAKDVLDTAQNDADRAAAKAKLEELQRERAEMENHRRK
jgi:hypothetical protein